MPKPWEVLEMKYRRTFCGGAHAAPVCVDDVQGCMQLPELGGRIDVEQEGVGCRPLHDAVVDARQRIGANRIGERRMAVLQEVVAIVLARVDVRVGEADVDEHAIGAGNGRDDAVEHAAVRFVLVEPKVDEVAQEPAGLGRAGRVGATDAAGERIGARVGLVAQERRDVARRGMPEAHHDRIPGRVDQLVNPVGIEAIEIADVQRRRGEAVAAARAAAKRPAVGRNRRPRRGDAVPDREGRMRRLEIGGFVRAKRRAALQVERERAVARDVPVRELDPRAADDRAAVGLPGDRKVACQPRR